MKKISTAIILMAICADISSAAYKSFGSRTYKSASVSKPYRNTSSGRTSQSTHAQAKKPTYYRAIPSNEPHVVVEKKDNFFWGMFWGAVLFSDHGKTTHVTNEIKQQVATENQGLWDEYQQNLEAIKLGEGDVDTLKARNKEILAIFKQKATEKYIAQFSIDAKEVASALLEEKNVTGVSGYADPSFFATLSGAERGAPIVSSQTYRRFTKTYQISLTGPEKIDRFKISLSDPKTATMERNASGLFVIYNQEFSDYSIGMQFVNKKDPSIVLSKTFDVGAGSISLEPLPPSPHTDSQFKNVAVSLESDDILHLAQIAGLLVMLGVLMRFLAIDNSGKSANSTSSSESAPERTPIGLKETYGDTQSPTATNDDQARTAVKTAKIRQQYYTNKKYRSGR